MESQVPKLPAILAYDNMESSLNEIEDLHRLFVQNVSHELRTPLSIVMGYAQLLNTGSLGDLTPEQNEAAFIIARKAQALTQMVERLGILLEIESETGMVISSVAIQDLIASTIEQQRPAAHKADLDIELDIETALPPIIGNRYHLEQAVDSLIENAIKFTPQGGRITVRAYVQDGYLRLEVTDTGIGIPAEKLAKITSGFYQADPSPTRRYGGLGLGLTLVNAVSKNHNGKLEIESQEGEGTTCILALPINTQARPEKVGGKTAEHHILVVDDEEVVGLTMKVGLEKLPDFTVQVATDGETALSLFEQEQFDLVITDYRMPDMNGLELARRLRQISPKTIVIFITGYDSEELHNQAALLDIQQILKKPVGLNRVRALTTNLLDTSGK